MEEESKAEKNSLLAKGITLILNGTDPDIVKRILQNYIIFSNYEGAELIQSLIIAEGVQLMQQGIHQDLIETALLSYLGVDGEAMYAEYKEQKNTDCEDLIYDYYKQLRTIVPAVNENKCLIKYLTTPPYCFQLLIKLDPVELACAMCCWDRSIQTQILAYLPYSRVKRIVSVITDIPKENRNEIAVLSQEKLSRSIDRLIAIEEIVLKGYCHH